MTPIHRGGSCGAAIATALLICGCFTGPYEQGYRQRLAEFRGDAEFAVLDRNAEFLADGRVTLRPPRQLLAQQQDEGTKLRARPPFLMQFPGYAFAREASFMAGPSKLPVVLTVGVVPAARQRHAEIEREILEQVRANEAFANAEWQKGRTVEPAADGPATWDVLSLQGSQEFESLTNGNVEYRKWPGSCEIWVSADPKQEFCTVVALRVPADVAENLELPAEQLAALVARTVAIVPPPDAAAEPAVPGP